MHYDEIIKTIKKSIDENIVKRIYIRLDIKKPLFIDDGEKYDDYVILYCEINETIYSLAIDYPYVSIDIAPTKIKSADQQDEFIINSFVRLIEECPAYIKEYKKLHGEKEVEYNSRTEFIEL